MLMVLLKGTMGFTILDEDCIDIRIKIFIKIDIFYYVHGPTIFHDGPALRNEHMYKGT